LAGRRNREIAQHGFMFSMHRGQTIVLHPLRPDTHRRLGGPLPHQLANGTRAHP